MPYVLPSLPYAYDALEPFFDARTMELHHTKHHQGYVDKLNAALSEHPECPQPPIQQLLQGLRQLPSDIQMAVRNQGGGHFNHAFFWEILSLKGPKTPEGALAKAIEARFGSFAAFQEAFKKAAVGHFGSGWVWLLASPKDGSLSVTTTPNQDAPVMEGVVQGTGTPILGLDLWEHAYYLKFQNRRPDYIDAFWKVVDWERVGRHYVYG